MFGGGPVLVLSKITFFCRFYKHHYSFKHFVNLGSNTKRDHGPKVQLGNITAAKVSDN